MEVFYSAVKKPSFSFFKFYTVPQRPTQPPWDKTAPLQWCS